ncbi:MAG: hypothetical protein M1818_007177 [Claussenomyces sp. TS43310]|nr:MAG: hypothetical protein M1818_007177 [Claussenomyces sp. TS43310]
MAHDKLSPNDARAQHKTSTLNGQEYHYLLAEPASQPARATIFLIHGFPDLAFGWRYTVPALLRLNLRVVVPDMMGYGDSAGPRGLEFYTLKRAADDLAALARALDAPEVLLLGHDWGGAIVWRLALWHPELVRGVISVCTPYFAPQKECLSLRQTVEALPNFTYQLQLAGPEVQERIQGRDKIRQFLNGVYGGWNEDGAKVGFKTREGVLFDNLPVLGRTKLLSDVELDYYADMFAKKGMEGPLNYYRTRELNWADERVFVGIEGPQIKVPSLLIQATKDDALPPSMSKGMEKHFEDLKIKQVDATHWALWQKPDECNALIEEFLVELLGSKANSLL